MLATVVREPLLSERLGEQRQGPGLRPAATDAPFFETSSVRSSMKRLSLPSCFQKVDAALARLGYVGSPLPVPAGDDPVAYRPRVLLRAVDEYPLAGVFPEGRQLPRRAGGATSTQLILECKSIVHIVSATYKSVDR